MMRSSRFAALIFFPLSIYALAQVGPARLVISPANPPLAVGQAPLQLTARQTTFTALNKPGAKPRRVTARWISENPAVATVNATGQVTAVATGTATITAISGPSVGTTVVTVPNGTLTGVTISPANPSVALGLTQQFTATASYSGGGTADATTVTSWSATSGTGSASIGANTGLAQTLTQGTVTITGSYGGFTPTTTLTVAPPALVSIAVTPGNPGVPKGLTQQFTATGTYTDKSTQDLTSSATWNSVTTSVATITSTGLASTLAQGTSTIQAISGSVTGSTVLTVLPPALVSIAISSAVNTVRLPHPNPFTATGTYTDGSMQDVTGSVTWGSTTPSVATIDSQGFASTVTQGSTNITAAGPNGVTAPAFNFTVNPALKPRYAYVGSPDTHTIGEYAVDPTTGQLRSRGYIGPFGSSSGFGSLAQDPLGRFVFSLQSGNGTISTFAINADGSLNPTAVATTSSPNFFGVVDPSGKYLYVVGGSAGIYGWAIQSNGSLAAIAGSPFATGSSPRVPVIDPAGKFLYVENSGSNSISGFAINPSTGALTAIPGSPVTTINGVINAPTFDPLDRRLYVDGTASSTSEIDAFDIDPSTGALTRLSGAPYTFNDTNANSSFVIDPAEHYAYVTGNFGTYVYTIDLATGIPTLVSGSPFKNAPQVDLISSSGLFGFAEGVGAGEPIVVSKFVKGVPSATSVNQQQSSFSHQLLLSEGTAGLTFAPQYVYVTNKTDNTVSAFSMDPSTGALAAVSGSPFAAGTGPDSVSTDPAGAFAYVANGGSNNVSVYQISSGTGALSAVTGSPFAAQQDPVSVAADISGQLVYVANAVSGSITGYTVNRTTGALTQLSNSPYSAVPTPAAIVTDPSGQDAFATIGPSLNALGQYAINLTPGTPPYGSLGGPSSQTTAGASPQGIAIAPSGSYAYVATEGSNNVEAFEICTTGLFGCSFQSIGTFPAHTQPVAVAITPNGKFLYVANFGSNDISIYAVNPNGTLVAYPGGPQAVFTGPSALQVDPSGQFLVVADSGANEVQVLGISPSTGALTPLSAVTTGKGPDSLSLTESVQ